MKEVEKVDWYVVAGFLALVGLVAGLTGQVLSLERQIAAMDQDAQQADIRFKEMNNRWDMAFQQYCGRD